MNCPPRDPTGPKRSAELTPGPADHRPFIVTLSVSVATFRATLADEVPDASLGRELPHHRVVVILPATLGPSLAALPGVDSVVPDELLKTLRSTAPRTNSE
jgi:hypothetical protein